MGIANIINNSTTTSGGEIIRELVNSSDGQGLHFDGSAGNFTGTPPDLGTKFSFELVVSSSDWNTDGYFIDFSSGGRFIFGSNGSEIAVFDQTSWKKFGVQILDDNKVHHLVVTIDGTSATLFDNGNQVATQTISTGHNIDSCGALSVGPGATGTPMTFYRCRFYNKTLSSTEVQTAFERADVGFSSQYGSQTELVTNGDFASATGWSVNNVTVAGDGNAVWAVSGGDQWVRRADWNITKGKKYRITVVSSAHTTNGSFQVFTYGATATIATTDLNGDAFTISGTGTHVFEFEALADSSSGVLFGRYPTGAAYVGTMTDLSCVQIGAVSDYDLAFANPTQSLTVQDRAGAADGTASTSGVTQVQKVVQLNSTSARIGTSAATPADGDIIVSGGVGVGAAAGAGGHGLTVDKAVNDDWVAKVKNSSNTTPYGLQVDCQGSNAVTAFAVYAGSSPNNTTFTIKPSGAVISGPELELSNATASKPVLTLENTTADANSSQLVFNKNRSGVGVNNDILGTVRFKGNNNAGTPENIEYATIYAQSTNVADGAEDGQMIFRTMKDGTLGARLTIDSTGLATFSNGIAFQSATTGSGTGAGYTLDSYEQGTYTATITGETTAGTHSNILRQADYLRIGNLCTVNGYYYGTNGTGSGNMILGGLPFNVKSGTAPVGSIQANSGLSITSGTWPQLIYHNTNMFKVRCSQVDGSAFHYAAYPTAPSYVRWTITYIVA